MKKKVISILLCASMVGSMLVGCGSKAAEPAKEETKKEEPKKETAKKKADPDAVKYVSMWSETEPQAITIKEASEAFTKETGVKIDIEFAGRQGIREGLQTRLDAKEDIDMFDEDIDRVIGQWGEKYLMDLSDYILADYKGKPYSGHINPAFDNIYKTVETLSGGDTFKAVPYQPFIFNMMYNKKIFAEAGVTETPKTWKDFLAACEKIKAKGYTPITVDNAYMTCLLGYTMAAFVGSDEVHRIVTENDWTNEAVVKSAAIWQEMAEKGYMSQYAATNIFPNGQTTEFAPGDAAMYLNGTWLVNELKADVNKEKVEFGIFPFPAIEGAKNGSEAANFGSQVFAINKDSKKADQAFQFIAWMTTGEWDKKLSENTLGIPMDVENAWPKELEQAKAMFPTLTTRYPWAAGMDDNPDNQATILEKFTSVVSGDMKADEFGTEMAKLKKK